MTSNDARRRGLYGIALFVLGIAFAILGAVVRARSDRDPEPFP